MVTTTWVVPSGVFFTSIIGWQYFVGNRSVPVGKCYVQYMESAVFNCLLQLGYFWATLIVMCALYTGIYRVALRLHRESAARRRNMVSVTAQATHHFGRASSTASTSVYKHVATANVSAACHRSNRHHSTSVVAGFSDSSLSEHDVTSRRHNYTNDSTFLLPPPRVSVTSSPRHDSAIELQEITHCDTSITAMTFTIDDDDIRFADDVTEDDDDVNNDNRPATSTFGNDVNLRYYHHHHLYHQQQQQEPSEQVTSRDDATGSLLLPTPQERHGAHYLDVARIDTANVPIHRRFSAHRRLSSRRRQRRSKTTTCERQSSSGSQVMNEFTRPTLSSFELRLLTSHVSWPQQA